MTFSSTCSRPALVPPAPRSRAGSPATRADVWFLPTPSPRLRSQWASQACCCCGCCDKCCKCAVCTDRLFGDAWKPWCSVHARAQCARVIHAHACTGIDASTLSRPALVGAIALTLDVNPARISLISITASPSTVVFYVSGTAELVRINARLHELRECSRVTCRLPAHRSQR